jgi:hypothetical protein
MSTWRTELRALTRRHTLFSAEITAMVEAVQTNESDRGAALIAGSLAENALEGIIQAHMRHLNKERLDQIFATEGVLSSFSAKIKVSYAFNLIDEEIRDEFDRIREIRNTFAHSKLAIDFNTPQVKRACLGLLRSKDEAKISPRPLYSNAVTFLVCASGLVLYAKNETHKAPRPITYDEALAFFQKWWKQLPPQIQESLLSENIDTTPPAQP